MSTEEKEATAKLLLVGLEPLEEKGEGSPVAAAGMLTFRGRPTQAQGL